MNEPPSLTTPRLLLAIPGAKAAHAQAEFYRRNADHLRPWEPPITAMHTDAQTQVEWLDAHVDMANNGSAYRFVIFDRHSGIAGDVLGHVNLHNVARGITQSAVLRYTLAQAQQGNGIMTEACQAIVSFAFETLKLHRLNAFYQTHNERSAAVLRRLAFEIEGIAKEYLYIDGAWRDHVLTARLNPTPIVPA